GAGNPAVALSPVRLKIRAWVPSRSAPAQPTSTELPAFAPHGVRVSSRALGRLLPICTWARAGPVSSSPAHSARAAALTSRVRVGSRFRRMGDHSCKERSAYVAGRRLRAGCTGGGGGPAGGRRGGPGGDRGAQQRGPAAGGGDLALSRG